MLISGPLCKFFLFI